MTNEEIVAEIRELKNDMQDAHKEQREEMRELKKEFYLFKGKAFGLISILTTGIGFFISYFKDK